MLLHADNFNYFGDDEDNMLDGLYAQVNTATIEADPDGVSVPKCLRVGSSSSDTFVRYVLPGAVDTVGVSLRIWMPALPSNTGSGGTSPAITLRDVSNNYLATLWITTTGAIVVSYQTKTGTILGQTTGPVLTAAGWYHLEWKHVIDAVAGTTEVRIEGITVIDESGLNTGATDVAQVGVGKWNSGAGNGVYVYYKDLVLWNGSGTENNDFLGSVIVYELLTVADTAFPTGWSSTGANGYSVLDNNPPVDASAYISADNSPPAAAVFELTNLPADVSSVKGIITRVRAAKSDGGDGQLQVSMRSNGSDDSGADRPLTTSETYWSDVSELDPDTSAAWLPGAVDDAQLVFERTV